MRISTRQATRGQGDRGVTMVLFALVLVAMLFVVALVLDFSNVRNSRQDTKLIADVSVTSGLQTLASDGTARPWRGVCTSLEYLKVNQPSLSFSVSYFDGSGTPVPGNPCTTLLALQCVAGTPTTWAWIKAVAGPYVFHIKSGYTLPDPAFVEDAAAYSGDNGVAGNGGCDHLATIVSKADGALFGGVADQSGYTTVNRSVGRVKIGSTVDAAPAFLMLERIACDTLSEQVGSGETGIVVDAASATQSGIIHVDSKGLPSAGCNGTNGPSGWTTYSSGTGGPKIVAKPSLDGTQPGIIALHALEVGLPPVAYAGSTAAGLSPAPVPGGVVSRKPIDEKYNPTTAPTIATIHSLAATDAGRTLAPPSSYPSARPGAWTVLACVPDPIGALAAKILVNCPGGFSAGAPTTFPNATDVIFTGPVTVPGGSELYLPAARRVVVGGNSTGGLVVANNGRLGINSVPLFANSEAGTTTACVGREGPAWPHTAELVVFGGRGTGSSQGGLNVSGRAALCQTFVYLAGPRVSSYAVQQTTDGSYHSSCVSDLPCPKTAGNPVTSAYLFVAGLLQWSAPNQLTTQPAAGAVGVEDLALWTETASMSEVKSGGDVRARGVFFLPNARLEMRSPGSATPRDAQFIARSLQLLQGTLRMQPTPSNAVNIPVLESVSLVR